METDLDIMHSGPAERINDTESGFLKHEFSLMSPLVKPPPYAMRSPDFARIPAIDNHSIMRGSRTFITTDRTRYIR